MFIFLHKVYKSQNQLTEILLLVRSFLTTLQNPQDTPMCLESGSKYFSMSEHRQDAYLCLNLFVTSPVLWCACICLCLH